MPKLKRLSGRDLVRIFNQFDFVVSSQKGSHIKLIRLVNTDVKQVLVIPNHAEVDTGTCRAIFRQASRYVPATELAAHFYTD